MARRSRAASLGKTLILRVRRLSSCWMARSMGLAVRMRRQWASGSENTARPSGTFCSSQAASLGALSVYPATMRASSASAAARSVAFQTARSWRPIALRMAALGAWWMALRARWNWHRCQTAPEKTAFRAAASPA